MVITFCGHSNLSLVNEEKHKLYLTIKSEIIKNPNCIFYLGAYGDFDILCRRIVFCLKQQYKNVKAVFITPYLDGNYSRLKYANEYFDETIYPPIERVPKKLAIIAECEYVEPAAKGGFLRLLGSSSSKYIKYYFVIFANNASKIRSFAVQRNFKGLTARIDKAKYAVNTMEYWQGF